MSLVYGYNGESDLGSSAKKTILLVDDHRDTCLTFKKMLEEQDFDVHAFDKPQDVMEKFRPSVYDLVVLDIKMLTQRVGHASLFFKVQSRCKDFCKFIRQ